MDWLKRYVSSSKTGRKKRKSHPKSGRKGSRKSGSRKSGARKSGARKSGARKSGARKSGASRYYITSSGSIVTAHRGAKGYYYVKRTENGTRKFAIRGTTYTTQDAARTAKKKKRER